MLTQLVFALALASAVVVVAVAFLGSQPVAPIAEVLAPEWNREFGVLELLQSTILLGIVIILIRDRRLAYQIVGLMIAYLLLEELDFFLHLWDWVVHGDSWRTDLSGYRNLHNRSWAQILVDVGYVFLSLGILAIAFWRMARPDPNASSLPMRRSVAVVIALMLLTFAVSVVAGRLDTDTSRQLLNESHELALYASAALIVCEIYRASVLRAETS